MGGDNTVPYMQFIPPYCDCKANPRKRAELKLSNTDRNPGRAFWSCYKCDKFTWLDESHIVRVPHGALGMNREVIQEIHNLRSMMGQIKKLVKDMASVGIIMYFVMLMVIMFS